MTRRSLLTSLFVLIATASLAAPPAGKSGGCRRLYEPALETVAVEVLNNKADPPVREARFRQLFHEDFDPGIARFVLGPLLAKKQARRSSRSLSSSSKITSVFVYTARFANFGGETIKIRGSRSDGDGVYRLD